VKTSRNHFVHGIILHPYFREVKIFYNEPFHERSAWHHEEMAMAEQVIAPHRGSKLKPGGTVIEPISGPKKIWRRTGTAAPSRLLKWGITMPEPNGPEGTDTDQAAAS
jgi:hypothetical protein